MRNRRSVSRECRAEKRSAFRRKPRPDVGGMRVRFSALRCCFMQAISCAKKEAGTPVAGCRPSTSCDVSRGSLGQAEYGQHPAELGVVGQGLVGSDGTQTVGV